MVFSEFRIRRGMDGRFVSKNGAEPEILLEGMPKLPRGFQPFEESEDDLATLLWRFKPLGVTKAHIERAQDFVTKRGLEVERKAIRRLDTQAVLYDIRYRIGREKVTDEQDAYPYGPVGTTVSLALAARWFKDSPDDEYLAGRDAMARRLFGDEYDALVNPPKSLVDRILRR